MTKEEIQASIKSIMFSGSVCGIEILRRIAQLYDVNVQDLFLNTRELKMPDVENLSR